MIRAVDIYLYDILNSYPEIKNPERSIPINEAKKIFLESEYRKNLCISDWLVREGLDMILNDESALTDHYYVWTADGKTIHYCRHSV